MAERSEARQKAFVMVKIVMFVKSPKKSFAESYWKVRLWLAGA